MRSMVEGEGTQAATTVRANRRYTASYPSTTLHVAPLPV
jgi:hypothetical protein